jgi:hypothetical protein
MTDEQAFVSDTSGQQALLSLKFVCWTLKSKITSV